MPCSSCCRSRSCSTSAVVHAQMLGWHNGRPSLIGSPGSHFGFAIPTQDLPRCWPTCSRPAPDAYAAQLDDALQWSPPGASVTRPWARCQASLVISMIAHRAVNHATMLLAFLSVLDAVLGAIRRAARRRAALAARPARDAVRDLPAAAHGARPVRPGDQTSGSPRSATPTPVADTVGLADLGLPDLQTLATGRDPAALAFRLVTWRAACSSATSSTACGSRRRRSRRRAATR